MSVRRKGRAPSDRAPALPWRQHRRPPSPRQNRRASRMENHRCPTDPAGRHRRGSAPWWRPSLRRTARVRHAAHAAGAIRPGPAARASSRRALPWVVVPELFGPAHIGGWSAAEHWGLTEQLFRSVCVLTTRPIRSKKETIQGIEFSLKHIRPSVMFGTQPIWRGSVKVVEISGPAKTIVDMLGDPALGGGIRHVKECLDEFL